MKNSEAVIFLDIDGVVNTINSEAKQFSSEAVQVLNEIVREFSAKVVLSSSWKEFLSFPQLNELFQKNGAKFSISDKTPHYAGTYSVNASELTEEEFYMQMGEHEGRNEEIWQYIKSKEISCFVILDDLPFSNKFLSRHLVRTSIETGLLTSQKESIRKVLKH